MAATIPQNQRRAAQENEARTVGPLLARANLLRMRGQWDEAVTVCTEALRQSPHSATAHALMGDIYDAQNRPEDAVTWYTMAVELNPNGAVDRAKLERLQTQQAIRLKQAAPPPAAQKEKTIERTIEWFDRAFPPGKSDSIARLLFAMSGGIAFVLILGFVYVYFVLPTRGNRGQAAPTLAAPNAELLSPVVMNPPRVRVPNAGASPVPVAPRSDQTSAEQSALASAPSPAEIALRGVVERAGAGVYSVVGLQASEATTRVTLDLIAVSATGSPEQMREAVLRASCVAAAATQQNGHLWMVSVRVHLPQNAAPQTGATNAASPYVFEGDLLPGAVSGVNPLTASATQLMPRFAGLRWFAPLRTVGGPEATTNTGKAPETPLVSPAAQTPTTTVPASARTGEGGTLSPAENTGTGQTPPVGPSGGINPPAGTTPPPPTTP